MVVVGVSRLGARAENAETRERKAEFTGRMENESKEDKEELELEEDKEKRKRRLWRERREWMGE